MRITSLLYLPLGANTMEAAAMAAATCPAMSDPGFVALIVLWVYVYINHRCRRQHVNNI